MPQSDLRTLGLLLIDGFALMSYASVIEPFRAANRLAGRELYRWLHVSIDGKPVTASNGAQIVADAKVGDALPCDALFLFAGGDPSSFDDPATFGWLRQLARSGVQIAGISGGPYILARAGLLDGFRATVHWEHQDAFREAFPTLALEPVLYVIDRGRMTCAGGTAGLDLATALIAREHGETLAGQVSDWFIRTDPRRADLPQRASLTERYGVTNERLLRVLAEMEATLDAPRSRAALAERAGISERQLERLFARHMNMPPGTAYREVRLRKAEQMLRATGLSVTEIALACGFASASHFSRCVRARFGRAPSAMRG